MDVREQIGMGRISDSAVDGIDIDNEEPGAGLCVGFAGEDGSWTSLTWGITSESAASVIALCTTIAARMMARLAR